MHPSLINIDNAYLNQIKVALAYPDVNNLLLDDPQIIEFCVYPAMYEYFKKFPLVTYERVQISNTQIVYPFPDDNVFTVLQARTVDKGYTGTPDRTFPFWEVYAFQRYTASAYKRSNYGTPYDFNGMSRSYIAQRQLRDAYIENLANFRYQVDVELRQLTIFSSIATHAVIVWGRSSNNFSDVIFEYQRDVIELAQAYLLQHAADATGIAPNSAMELTIDTSELKTKADERFSRVRDKWAQIPHTFIMNFN